VTQQNAALVEEAAAAAASLQEQAAGLAAVVGVFKLDQMTAPARHAMPAKRQPQVAAAPVARPALKAVSVKAPARQVAAATSSDWEEF